MGEDALPGQRRVPTWLRGAALAVLLAMVGAFGWALGAIRTAWLGQRGPTTHTLVARPSPQVVVAVRDLAQLSSAEFHMERVIDLRDQQQHLFGLVHAQDAILLVASGVVTAGVDLSELGAEEVRLDPDRGSATLTLPPPSVLSTHLDTERTHVHSRRTDVLARRNEQLESEARREAERTLRDAAIEAGILERARVSAERTIGGLVRALGYRNVAIEWQTGPTLFESGSLR